MRRRSMHLGVLLALTAVSALMFSTAERVRAAASVHPRLLFTSADLPALRAKVRDGVGFDDAEYTEMVARADVLLGLSGSSLVGGYQGVYNVTTLGTVYQLSSPSDPNRSAYQAKCQETLAYIAANNDPESGDAHNSSLRLFVLALGFDLCFDTLADGASIPPERQTIIDEISRYLRPAPSYQTTWFDWYSRQFPPYTSNKGFILGSAMGLGSIVLRGETTDVALLDEALAWGHAMVLANLDAEIGSDGSPKEGELYGPFAMRYLIPYIEARQRYDGVDLSQRPEVRGYERWIGYIVHPTNNGYTFQANNGNYTLRPFAWNDTYQSWAQSKYSSQIARWAWERTSGVADYGSQRDQMAIVLWNQGAPTEDPSATLPDSMLFRERGMYYYRSGWPALGQAVSDDTVFSFYAGPFGGGHAQEDQGTFSLFSKQNWFSRDSGAGAKQSEAHNMVFIDGAGQHNAGSSVGTDGAIDAFNLNPFADYLQADLKAAYDTYSPLNALGTPFPNAVNPTYTSDWSWGYAGANPVRKADRHLLVVKGAPEAAEYFVFYDDIEKDGGPHTYDWVWHTESSFALDTASNPVVITGNAADRKLEVYFANPPFGSLSFSSAAYANGALDPDTKRIKATATGVVNPQFLVVLQPVLEGTTLEPTRSSPAGASGAIVRRFTWPTVTDDLYVRTGASFTHGTLSSDAAMALVRRDGSGAVRKFVLGEGTTLDDGGTTLVAVSGGTATVSSDGVTVSVSDPALAYRIEGPNVSRVRSNHVAQSFTRSGGAVYVNGAPPLAVIPGSVSVVVESASSATVRWATDLAATSVVEYGLTDAFGSTAQVAGSSTSHVVTLGSLTPGSTYHFRVASAAGGAQAYSADGTFVTPAGTPADTTPPDPVTDLRTR